MSYCQTAAQILEVTATIDHMQRVDRASGTVNLTKRRELAETLLVLKDQMSQQRRVLTDLGRHPTTTEGTNADGMLRRAREACIPMVPAGGATSK